jgi:hypothetical protein
MMCCPTCFASVVADAQTNLGVADKDENSVRALLVVRVDLACDGLDTSRCRLGVAVATARGLATAGGVVDDLGGRARVRVDDRGHDGRRGAVTGGSRRLASTKDVHRRAVGGRHEGRGQEEEGGGSEARHLWVGWVVSRRANLTLSYAAGRGI